MRMVHAIFISVASLSIFSGGGALLKCIVSFYWCTSKRKELVSILLGKYEEEGLDKLEEKSTLIELPEACIREFISSKMYGKKNRQFRDELDCIMKKYQEFGELCKEFYESISSNGLVGGYSPSKYLGMSGFRPKLKFVYNSLDQKYRELMDNIKYLCDVQPS